MSGLKDHKTAKDYIDTLKQDLKTSLSFYSIHDHYVRVIAKLLLDYDVGIRDNSGKRPIREDAES